MNINYFNLVNCLLRIGELFMCGQLLKDRFIHIPEVAITNKSASLQQQSRDGSA